MDSRLVKTASGRRLRHPDTKKVMSCIDDADSAAHPVDLDDPHWYRAWQRGDIVEVNPGAPSTASAKPAPALAPKPAAAATPSEGQS